MSQIVDPLSKLPEISKNDLKKYSTWVTLQVNNPNIVPPLYWQIDAWPKSDDTLQPYPVSFTQNAFRLVLTDQSLYNFDIVPSSLAQVAPLVTIQPNKEQNPLNIEIVATKQDKETKEIAIEQLFYTGKQILDPDNQNNKKWQESINLSNLITTFSPTQVPQILREYQDIPIPEWFPLLENDPSEVGSVAAWQNILYGCGYTSEPRITGVMDLETVNLTKKFQKDLGLKKTDKLTLETWQAGLDILKNDPSKVGSVAAWQNILYRCGYTSEPRITGVMDLETVNLTKKFQKDLGLKETGEVTLETWQAGLKHKKIFNWFHWISSKKTIEPALIWGFMPLEDGWAQLPFINLTEQIYLDANITSLNGSNFQATAQKALPLLQGAVSFGNDRESVRKQEQVMGENAWSVTLVDGTNLVEKWKLQKKQNQEYELTDIELTIEKPDINIQGLLWLSTGKPRSQDALPDFSNWVSGLRSIPLRTLQLERETFPPLIELLIEKLSFTPQNSSEEKNNQLIPVASLGQWQFRYQLR